MRSLRSKYMNERVLISSRRHIHDAIFHERRQDGRSDGKAHRDHPIPSSSGSDVGLQIPDDDGLELDNR